MVYSSPKELKEYWKSMGHGTNFQMYWKSITKKNAMWSTTQKFLTFILHTNCVGDV